MFAFYSRLITSARLAVVPPRQPA